MGDGYDIGCKKCITQKDLDKYHDKNIEPKGTMFHIMTSGGFSLFCKEQLDNIYRGKDDYYEGTPTNDESIDKLIYANLENGYKFTKHLGDLPYYCETCNKLETRFYFEMKKDKTCFVPEYHCKTCNAVLEPVCTTWEKHGGGTWADTLKHIKFKYFLYDENNDIIFKTKKEEKKLVCDNCKCEEFSIHSHFMYD